MMKKVFFIMLLLSVLVNGTQAQEEHLKLHFDFSKVDGTSVTDIAGGITAGLMGSATIEKALAELVKDNRIQLISKGRYSKYFRL